MKCPNCGVENIDTNQFCLECGTKLPEQIRSSSQPHQTRVNDEIRYSPSRTNNYMAARFLGSLLKILSWVSLGLMLLSVYAAIGTYENSSFSNQLGLDFYLSVFSVIFNMSMAAVFAIMSEGINLILDTEANTRQTAKTLERILRSQNT